MVKCSLISKEGRQQEKKLFKCSIKCFQYLPLDISIIVNLNAPFYAFFLFPKHSTMTTYSYYNVIFNKGENAKGKYFSP